VVVNAIALTRYAFENVYKDMSALELSVKFGETLSDVEKIFIFTVPYLRSSIEKKIKTRALPVEYRERETWDLKLLIQEMGECSRNRENIFYFYGDCPLLEESITSRMYRNHLRYFAQYTFADGYPYGLTPEILNVSILSSLEKLVSGGEEPVERNSIFSVIQKDINSFDLETEISPADTRLLRVSLTCDTQRNYIQTGRIISEGGVNETAILDIILNRQELLRTLPAYVAVQIIDGCLQSCSYCPFPLFGGDILNQRNLMSLKEFAEILKKVEEFADDAVLALSLWGEPALHSQIAELLEETVKHKKIYPLVETSGIGWNKDTLKRISENVGNVVQWIVSLDAHERNLYKELRGEGMEEALHTCDILFSLFPGRVHVQAVRMKYNEENLETFFREWKKRTPNVIIQKYDHFCNFLPQRKVTDLSPVKRHPCWHLKRDLVILLDGTVPLCREDIKRNYILGNIFEQELSEIWQEGERYYLEQLKGIYNPLCEKCDEYYTFNF